ncbi:MAG: FecR family protein [Halofilum sp. (in: g-proteobacteria)]|nr:FecR family protein [Halofilum sp. (in: g-proteobacteria)]
MKKSTLITSLLVMLLWLPAAFAEDAAYDQLPEDRVLYIAPGQSLSALVERLYPEQPDRWAGIRDWIVKNNAHAFIGGDPDRLRADVRVKLPSGSELAERDPYSPAPAEDTDDAETAAALEFRDRYVFVDPAQSLSELVPRLYPGQRERWEQIIDAILARNNDRLADMDGDNRISRGTRLRIPESPAARPARGTDSEAEPETGAAAPPTEPVVAEVVSRTGELHAVDAADRRRELTADEPIRRGDTLHTGEAGRAEIEFRDGERVSLRPGSRLRVRDWNLPDTGPGTRIVELLEGGLRAVTGAIGNRDADTYRTVSQQTTLGIRGTEYSLRICAEDECRPNGAGSDALREGLYVGVDKGRVSLLNESGETTVEAGQLRYVAGPASAPVEADQQVTDILYTEAEQAARAEETMADTEAAEEAEDEGTHWGWIVLGIVLLGAAL